MNSKTLSITSLAALSALPLCGKDASNPSVTYDLSTQRSIAGESELQRDKYFNIHTNAAYNPIDREDHELLRQLDVGFGRGFNGPFWYYPGKKSLDAPFPSETQAAAMSRAITDLYTTSLTYPYRDRRLVVTDHPYDTFHMDMDTEAAADWTVAFFKHFYTDEDRPLFYEPMNEPFVHAKDYGKDNNAVKRRMAELYRDIGIAFDKSGLDVQVIGYASAWPSMELNDFWHWDTNMKMFMDVAGDYMDGISIHLYDGTNVTGQDNRRSGSNADAIMDLVETYSFIKWGKVKPLAITEYGDIPKGYPEGYTPEKSSQEHRAYNHILFQLLERQDRIMTSVPFITSKSPWYYEEVGRLEPYLADLWRPDPDSVVDGQITRYLPTEKIAFYDLWKDVGGVRTASVSDNPDIAIQTFVDGNRAFVCLNNYDDFPQTVSLKSLSGQGDLKSGSIRRLNVPPREAAKYSDELLSAELGEVTIQPYETIVIVYEFAEPIQMKRGIRAETSYSKTHLVPIKANEPIEFTFEEVPANASLASLRMSIGRKPKMSKEPKVYVNGTEVEMPKNWAGYDQGNRKDFFGAIPIPFAANLLKPTTTVKLVFPDDGGRVSSVVLLTETPD
ncbi:MAG: T9SS C-terminal target domain-containing protein [Verrucomicrobiota bacterium]